MAQGDNRSVSVVGDVTGSSIDTADHSTTTNEFKQVMYRAGIDLTVPR